jgi:site-specific recombinase XerD
VQLSAMIPDFLLSKEVEAGCSPRTVLAYRYDLSMFQQTIGDLAIENIRLLHIRQFLKVLYDKNYTKSALARKIACLKSFFQFCFENEIIEKNPMMTIKSPKIRAEEALPKFLTQEETTLLLTRVSQLKGQTRAWINRLEILIRILYATMGRISEICGISLQDINLNQALIKVRGKGNKERYIPLDPTSVSMLRAYLQQRLTETSDLTQPLFVNLRGKPLRPRTVQRDLQALKKVLGLPPEKKFTPHVFRHTGATHLRQNGMDISELQDLLGHASPSTTRIYAKNDITHLQQSYMHFHPLVSQSPPSGTKSEK